MKTKSSTLLLSILSLFILSSCVTKIDMNDPNDIQLNTSLALPIGNVHANIGQFIGEIDSNYISTNEDKTIFLTWEEDFGRLDFFDINISAEDAIKEELTLATKSPFKEIFEKLPPTLTEVTIPIDTTLTFSLYSSYNIDYQSSLGEESIIRIDTILLKKTYLDLGITTEGIEFSDEMSLSLDFNYPNFIEDSTLFKNVKITDTNTFIKEDISNLKAYLYKLPKDGKADISLDFKLFCKKGIKINKNMKLKFNSKIKLEGLDELYGFVWKKDPVVDTEVSMDMPTDFFNNPFLANNKLLFSNPQVELNLNSNVGIPLECTIDHICATDINNEKYYADFNGSQSYSIILNTPKNAKEKARTTINLNKDNGGTNKLFRSLPKTINYAWKIRTPYKNIEGNYFVTDPIDIDADIKATIPMQFDPNTSFEYADTIAADMTSLAETINVVTIDTLNLHLDIENSIPATLSLRLHYLNANGDLLNSTKTFTIPSALVDSEGKVTTPTTHKIIIGSNNDNIEDICETKQIIVEVSLKNIDEKSKIYFQTTNGMDIRISAFFKGDVNIQKESAQ